MRADVCPANPQEVCGGDGVTYACKEVPQQKGIAVLNTGACKQIDPRKLHPHLYRDPSTWL